MEDIEKEINEQDTYENQDVETIQAMQSRFDAELAKEKQKYSALLKYATEGGKVSADTNTPKEPTPDEIKEYLKDVSLKFMKNEIKGADKIATLEKVQDIVRKYPCNDIKAINHLNIYKSIYQPTSGTPTEDDVNKTNKYRDLVQFGLETCDNDTSIFQATVASKLKDTK